MRVQSLILLIAVVGVGSAVYYFVAAGVPGNSGTQDSYLIPGLAQNLDDVTKVALYGGGNTLLAEISMLEENWVVSSRGGYPADLEVLRNTLFNLAEARLTAMMTAKPENYRKIGVEDISDTQAQGLQILINGLNEPVRVIVGNQGKFPDTRFVRLAGHTQSWLINNPLEVDRDGAAWLRKEILDISPERMKSVHIRHADDGSEILIESRALGSYEFVLSRPVVPEGRKAAESQLSQVANALSSLQLSDVASMQSFKEEIVPLTVTTFRLFDGLKIDAKSFASDEKKYVTLNINFQESHERSQENSAAAREFAEKTKSRVEGWAFVLPAKIQQALIPRLEELLLAEKA